MTGVNLIDLIGNLLLDGLRLISEMFLYYIDFLIRMALVLQISIILLN